MNVYRVESDMKYFSKEDLEAMCEDELTEDTRVWLKQLVVSEFEGTGREPDWSFHPGDGEAYGFHLQQLRNGTDGREWVPLHFPQIVYEKFSGIANYIHGYRVIKDFIDGRVCVYIKPKIRYSALRHVLEYSLHNWAISNNLGNELFSSSGPIGR
jgi:hypothetical protein